MLSPADKKWLIRLAGTLAYLIITALRYPAKQITRRGIIRYLFKDLEPKDVDKE